MLDSKICFISLTILSSSLLFLVQPMVSKWLLPYLGGSPQVWNVCLLFFQAALLAGYGYAHWLASRFQTKFQVCFHLGFLGLALVLLGRPFHTPDFQAAGHPVLWLLSALAGNIALPFIVLSASAPLIQKWFSETRHAEAGNPYTLYAASNLGSLVALLSYPFLVERFYPLEVQKEYWRIGFGILCGLFLFCSFLLRGSSLQIKQFEVAKGKNVKEGIAVSRLIQWTLLAFVTCSLMMGVTTHITTDVAAVPLLWIIPLAIYLISFIAAFSRCGQPFINFSFWFFPYVTVVLALLLALHVNHPFWLVMGWNVLSLGVMALCCHGRLALDKPDPKHLTLYYLCISVGGVLGGIFNALLAPLIFKSILEYPLAIILACLMQGRIDVSSKKNLLRDIMLPGVIACLVFFLIHEARFISINQNPIFRLGALILPALAGFAFRKKPVRFAVFMAFLLLFWRPSLEKQNVQYVGRSFFGVHRVLYDAANRMNLYYHGTTNHGVQYLDPEKAKEPTAYFHKTGPVGELFSVYKEAWHNANVGVVGLGVGILVSYAEPDQQWSFFEIDKTVQDIAEKSGFFTYLKNAVAPYAIFLGDGRILVSQQPDQTYNVLFLDAFSSDSVPIHLLTREAVQLYFKKMKPRGVVAFNISNRNLNLQPVLGAIASSLDLTALVRCDDSIEKVSTIDKYASCWAVLARNTSELQPLIQTGHWMKVPHALTGRKLWTDHYSNIFDVLSWDFTPSFAILKEQ